MMHLYVLFALWEPPLHEPDISSTFPLQQKPLFIYMELVVEAIVISKQAWVEASKCQGKEVLADLDGLIVQYIKRLILLPSSVRVG